MTILVRTKKTKNRNARGCETFTLGAGSSVEAKAAAMYENEVILTEDNFEETYKGFDPRSSESYIIFELMRSHDMEQSVKLAEMVQRGMVKSSALNDRGVSSAGFLTAEDRLSRSMHGRRRRPFPSDRNLHWLRAPGMHIHEAGSFAYLIPKEQDSVFGVDGIGPAVVALLSGPLSVSEAARLLAEIYPQTGQAQLESDLSLFFRSLYERGLIAPVS